MCSQATVTSLRVNRLKRTGVDLGEIQPPHKEQRAKSKEQRAKSKEQHIVLGYTQGKHPLKPDTDVDKDKPHDPEKKRLSEIIEALNSLFGAETTDEDQLHFAQGIAGRISRQDDVMAQVNNHSEEQVMHGLLRKRVTDSVLDAMSDNEKMSLEVLDSEIKLNSFALLIYKLLKSGRNWDRHKVMLFKTTAAHLEPLTLPLIHRCFALSYLSTVCSVKPCLSRKSSIF